MDLWAFAAELGDSMTIIKATGKRNNKKIVVVCECDNEKADFAFDGEQNIRMAAEILVKVSTAVIGGTYYPETLPLKILAVLESDFFDFPPAISVEGELEEIPGEKGVVY